MTPAAWIYVGLFAVGVILFWIYAKMGKLLRCILFSAVSGLAALFAVGLIARFTAFSIAFTPLTVLTSAILGIPGVVLMLISNLL